MRDVVRDNFVSFTAPMEGVVPWMYQDVKGWVSIGIGNLIDPIQYALPLPFVGPDGNPADRSTIAAEWLRIKNFPDGARLGHRAVENVAKLRLTAGGVQDLVARKLAQMDAYLAKRFPAWETWPADAQLATLSMAWANGPAFRFPKLEAALLARDFAKASTECHMDETGNPGLKPRNIVNRMLYMNAALTADPSRLYWPRDLSKLDDDEEVTKPNLVPTQRPSKLQATTVTKLPFSEPDDEPPKAA